MVFGHTIKLLIYVLNRVFFLAEALNKVSTSALRGLHVWYKLIIIIIIIIIIIDSLISIVQLLLNQFKKK